MINPGPHLAKQPVTPAQAAMAALSDTSRGKTGAETLAAVLSKYCDGLV